jgi:transcriptional/translational regulatory protein YebC/TACO1
MCEINYEGYAPGGVAMFVDDQHQQREPHGGQCAQLLHQMREQPWAPWARLAHVFERKAEFIIEDAALNGLDGDEFEMACIDAGADDVLRMMRKVSP